MCCALGAAGTRSWERHAGPTSRDSRIRLTYLPVAYSVAATAFCEIDMDVFLMKSVRSRTEHGHEAGTSRPAQVVAKISRYLHISEPNYPSVGELERTDIERV